MIPNGNTQTTPVEIFETRYPFLERHYRLRTDSGGPGRQRGGLGSDRILEVRAPEITMSALFDRMVMQPWGIFGGEGGDNSELLIRPAGSDEFVTFREAYGTPSNSRVSNIKLKRGDRVLLRSSGGGGYGKPEERPVEAVLADVREDFVSIQGARDDYGVAIVADGKDLAVDHKATAELRSRPLAGSAMMPDRRGAAANGGEAGGDLLAALRETDNEPQGHWEALEGDWWDPGIINCEMCGQMIPRDVWVAADGLRVCSHQCDRLYRSYRGGAR